MAKKTKPIRKTSQSLPVNKNLYYALIVLGLILVLYLTMNMGAKKQYTTEVTPKGYENTYPEIVDGESLNKANMDLDNADLNEIDTELSDLDTESSNF